MIDEAFAVGLLETDIVDGKIMQTQVIKTVVIGLYIALNLGFKMGLDSLCCTVAAC